MSRKDEAARIRAQIQVDKALEVLHDALADGDSVTFNQLQAAKYLIDKVLPALTAVEHSGEVGHRNLSEMSEEELLDIAATGRAGSSEDPALPPEPPPVH